MQLRGALAEKDKYSGLFLRIAQTGGLLIPLVLIAYGVAVVSGVAQASPIYSVGAAISIFVSFLVLGVTQYIVKPSTPLSFGVFAALYHILSILYVAYVTGFASPIIFCWIILSLITEVFFGRLAGILSLVTISSAGIFLYVAEPVLSVGLTISYVTYLIIIVASSLFVGRLRNVQLIEHGDFKRTQVQEQYQREQLTTLINSLNAAIMSTSSNGTVRVYNAALLSLLDTNQSLSGKKIDDVLHLYTQAGEAVSLTELMQKTTRIMTRDDLLHRFDDGEEIRLDMSCAPIHGKFTGARKGREGFIFIIRDITQEKSLEEERDEFISVVSHELRTPITIAEGTLSNVQLLLDRGQDPAQLGSAVKDAHEQVMYLASMVNDLATLSRAERGVADTPEEVDVRQLLEELYHRYQPKASEKGLALNIDATHSLGTIFVSRLYLEEILQNFITNAIKYTPRGSVTIEAHRTTGGIEFAVKDTGIGISKSDQKHMFEKFYRSEDYRTRETSGTGLGLYVVKKLAHKLSTQIEFASRLNHGSTFSFILHALAQPSKPDDSLTKPGS